MAHFDLPDLLKGLERYHIQGGIVSHFASISYDPTWANEQVLAAILGTGFWAGITLLPEMFDSQSAGRSKLEQSIARGARLARLFPRSHNFSLRSWCCGEMIQVLVDVHLPLAIWHTEVSWEEIRQLCEEHPELSVIVEGTPQKLFYHTRSIYPLLKYCPNLIIELHNVTNYLGVEEIVRKFGAQRLVFGSYLPVCDPNAAMMLVTHARISEQEKELIAHGNISALINQVKPN
jgi:hypothetical protein